HCIVEFTNVEPGAECFFGFAAERPDRQLAHFVRERLSRQRDVAIDLSNRLLWRVCAKVLDRLIARPAELMNARIDDQTNGAKSFTGELSVPAVRVAVEPQLRPKGLRIQRPSLRKRRVKVTAPYIRE